MKEERLIMEDVRFMEFLDTVDDRNKDFVMDLHGFLAEKGCKCEIKEAKSGYTVSYIPKGNKRVLATFVCRKTGVKMRIYPEHIREYENFLDTLPEKMKKEIVKASVCKRLINPDDCNPKCVMGYDFKMDDENYKKCRYMAFMPAVNMESSPFIKLFLEKELVF